MTEEEVQALAVATLRSAQGAQDPPPYHTMRSEGSEEGFPDLAATVRGAMWYVECKGPAGRLTGAQLRWLHALAASGCRTFVATPDTLPQLAAMLGVMVPAGAPRADLTSHDARDARALQDFADLVAAGYSATDATRMAGRMHKE